MAELKREYVVPLRRQTRFAPKWRRSKKAIAVLKDFIRKHMKVEDVVVCKELNELIWQRGSKNPPGKVSVVALKTTVNGVEKVLVNLLDVGVEGQKALYATPEEATQQTQAAPTQEAEVTEETKEEYPQEETEEKQKEETKDKEVKKDE